MISVLKVYFTGEKRRHAYLPLPPPPRHIGDFGRKYYLTFDPY